MTLYELLALLRRRWYAALAGLLVVGLVPMLASSPVYSTSGDVVLVAPDENESEVLLLGQSPELVDFAIAVERVINDGRKPFRLNSVWAPLAGAGFRDRVVVAVPNAGSQWTLSFPTPELRVEVVAGSEGEVLTRFRQTMLDLEAAAVGIQDEAGVTPDQRIRLVPRTLSPTVNGWAPLRRNKARALVGLVLLGAAAALSTAYVWDITARARNARRSRADDERAADPAADDAGHLVDVGG